jgi:hypothetical protein
MKKIIMHVVISVSLTGCVTQYVEPDNGPMAKVTVPKFNSEYKLLGGFSGGAVMLATKGQDDCGEFSKISTTEIGQEDITVNVSAGSDLFISVGRFVGNSSCNVVGLFTPLSGSEYSVEFGNNSKRCGVVVYEKDSNGGKKSTEISRAYASTWDGIKVCTERSKL